MNLNKISCQKYVSEQNEYNSSPILELSVKFASQICHENINKPLAGTDLLDFGIDIKQAMIPFRHVSGHFREQNFVQFWPQPLLYPSINSGVCCFFWGFI